MSVTVNLIQGSLFRLFEGNTMSSNRMINLSAIAVICLGAAVSSQAFAAGSQSATMAVSAAVESACTLSTTALAFPSYTGTAQVDGTATLTVTCTNDAPYSITLGAGTGTGATTTQRVMTGTANGGVLNYALYRDSAHTLNWGDTVGTDDFTGAGTGAAQAIAVNGVIAANQLSSVVDNYTDSVAVNITY